MGEARSARHSRSCEEKTGKVADKTAGNEHTEQQRKCL